MPKSSESRAKNYERRSKKHTQQTSRAIDRGAKEAEHNTYTNSDNCICDIVSMRSSHVVVMHPNAATNTQPIKKKEEDIENVEEVKQPRKNMYALLANDSSDED